MLFHPQQKGMSQVNSTRKTCSTGDSIRDFLIPDPEGGHQQPSKGSRFHHPKKGTKELPGTLQHFSTFFLLLPCPLAVNQRQIFSPYCIERCW